MHRQMLMRSVAETLQHENYTYLMLDSAVCDVFASHAEKQPYALKILDNIDSYSAAEAQELKQFSHLFQATPHIIGRHASQKRLDDDVLYFRHHIPCVSHRTFTKSTRRDAVFLVYKNGRYYVDIDTTKLRDAMERYELSRHGVAQQANISVTSLHRLEHTTHSDLATLETAMRLEAVLGDIVNEQTTHAYAPLVQSLAGTSSIARKMQDIALEAVDFLQVPFTAGATDRETDDVFIVRETRRPSQRHVALLDRMREVTESHSFLVVQEDINTDFPYLRKDEFFRLHDKDGLRNVCQ